MCAFENHIDVLLGSDGGELRDICRYDSYFFAAFFDVVSGIVVLISHISDIDTEEDMHRGQWSIVPTVPLSRWLEIN